MNKLQSLRNRLKEHNLDAYLVPRADEYQGEFVAPYAERLQFLTGFTGSAGMAIITTDKAAFFTDARYTDQAKIECKGFDIFDSADKTPHDWAEGEVKTIGYDPFLHTISQIQKWRDKGFEMVPLSPNLVDEIWKDQPAKPQEAITQFPDHIAGKTAAEKLEEVCQTLAKEDIQHYILTAPDSIAWLGNIRGDDIKYIPYVLTYALINVTAKTIELFDMPFDLSLFTSQFIGMDFDNAPDIFKTALEEVGANIKNIPDPATYPKSIKTPQEQEAIRKAHIEDGAAVVKFLHWLDNNTAPITEMDVVKKLEEFRQENPNYKGKSFPTIAGWAANGAIIHYRPTKQSHAKITTDNLLLLDSGGQYAGGESYGTTDITRTIVIGAPTAEMVRNNTLVLQGHIDLAMAEFKQGTTGKDLDDIARSPLKDHGLNYAHGTGHGVGCYLAVHETAANISPKGEKPMQAGMLVSNEPGYYKTGVYGIRIENLILAQEKDGSLDFETVTLAPYDTTLIDADILTAKQKNWLNAYHKEVLEKLSPYLNEDQKNWLKEKTAALN